MIQVLDADGCLVCEATRTENIPARFTGEGYSENIPEVSGFRLGKDQMLTQAGIIDRPRLDVGRVIQIAVGEPVVVTGVPAGTTVSIEGSAPVAVEDEALELVFPVAGRWRVFIDCPHPWMDTDLLVEVTDAN